MYIYDYIHIYIYIIYNYIYICDCKSLLKVIVILHATGSPNHAGLTGPAEGARESSGKCWGNSPRRHAGSLTKWGSLEFQYISKWLKF